MVSGERPAVVDVQLLAGEAGAGYGEQDAVSAVGGGAEGYTDYPTLDCALTARVA